MTTIKQQLQQLIATSLDKLEIPYSGEIHLEHPANPEHGEWSTNVAMLLFAEAKRSSSSESSKFQAEEFRSPRNLAEKIIEQLKSDLEELELRTLILEITVAGPGFINFYLSDAFYVAETAKVADQPLIGVEQKNSGKLAIVEFSSPNIAKPFTIGHLRSTIIGHAVANLLAATGYTVLRDNHLGDWGTQFGKQIYAIKTWGTEEEIAQAERPVKKLVELYVKFHQEAEKDPSIEEKGREWFKKLEDGDPEARRLWQQCIDWSWQEFDKIYQQLNVSFSTEFDHGRGLGESFFEDKMGVVIEELEQHQEYYQTGENGAKLFFFPEEKLPPLMILKKDGATLYATRDLATDKYRKETYHPDLIVNEVGGEQALYFRQIFEVERLLGWFDEGQRVHVKHGLYRFKDKKMSTRKGNVIWLEDVLAEAEKRAFLLASSKHDIVYEESAIVTRSPDGTPATKFSTISNNAKKIGIGALKWNDLRRSSEMDIVFDWDEMLSMEGNSGPYLQYTHVRANSILQKFQDQATDAKAQISWQNITIDDYQLNDEERAVLRQLSRFGEAVERAATEFAPHHLCTYLFEVAQAFNSFYNKHSVLGGREDPSASLRAGGKMDEQTKLRLLLVQATQQVIGEGLGLLGIETVQKM